MNEKSFEFVLFITKISLRNKNVLLKKVIPQSDQSDRSKFFSFLSLHLLFHLFFDISFIHFPRFFISKLELKIHFSFHFHHNIIN